MPRVVIYSGPTPRVCVIGDDATIGRQPDNAIHIVEPNASRRHARITGHDGEYSIEDLNSSNGTEVNGQRISKAALHHGDTIRIGATKLVFENPAAAAAAAVPAPPDDAALETTMPGIKGGALAPPPPPTAPMPKPPPASARRPSAPEPPPVAAPPPAPPPPLPPPPSRAVPVAPPAPAPVAMAAPPPAPKPSSARMSAPAEGGKALAFETAQLALQQAFNAATECVYIIEDDFTLQRVNIPGKFSTTDAAYSGLVGQKCYEVLKGRNTVCEGCPAVEAVQKSDTATSRFPNDYAGRPRPVSVRASPQRDDQGKVDKIMLVVRAEAVVETGEKRTYSVQVDGPEGSILRAEFSTRGKPFTLGRAKTHDIVVDDAILENPHLVFDVTGSFINVENKSSKDNVTVNQQKLPPGAKLRIVDAGEVKVGPYTLKFQKKRAVATMMIRRAEGGGSVADVKRQFIMKKVWPEFEGRLKLVELERRGAADTDIRREALKTVREILATIPAYPFEGTIDRELLATECASEFVALGPLEELLEDGEITEIMVLGADTIYVERKGIVERSDRKFLSTSSLRKIIERIVAAKNRRIDESMPYVDTRLDDGSRVHAIIPPLAIDYPVLTIRKFPKRHLGVDDLIKYGSMDAAIGKFLEIAVEHKQSMIVSGGTGSGKTTILNILSRFIPSNERIITVEDSAELRLQQPHVVRLEARPANIEGHGEVSIRDLVRNCLRMRPDRIIVGECRGREAFDMLQAMNTGHEGSMTTVHANTTRDALGRIESMCLMAGLELPIAVIRQQIASAVNFVFQQSRLMDGTRKNLMISEITGLEGGNLLMQPIFEFKQTGVNKEHKIEGHYTATGMIPKFVERMRQIGVPVPLELFKPR